MGVVVFMRNPQELAALIKELLADKKITSSFMLKELGLNKDLINTIQTKGFYPRIEAIVKIADFLDVSIDYLLGRTDKPEVNK